MLPPARPTAEGTTDLTPPQPNAGSGGNIFFFANKNSECFLHQALALAHHLGCYIFHSRKSRGPWDGSDKKPAQDPGSRGDLKGPFSKDTQVLMLGLLARSREVKLGLGFWKGGGFFKSGGMIISHKKIGTANFCDGLGQWTTLCGRRRRYGSAADSAAAAAETARTQISPTPLLFSRLRPFSANKNRGKKRKNVRIFDTRFFFVLATHSPLCIE